MRVAFITFEYPPFIIGGAGIYALNITHELAKLGHQVVVFTLDSSEIALGSSTPNLVVQRVSIHKNLPFKALQFWLRLPNEVKKLERRNRFDIIHFNGISYWFVKRKLSKAKHIVTVHHLIKDAIKNNHLGIISRIKDISGENNFFMFFLERNCITFSDKLIAVSNFTKKQIIESYNIDPEKINVIYNGIDLNDYSFTKEEITKTKNQLNLIDRPIILFVGRVDDPRKNLDLLLRSLRKVLEKIDVTLLVVGKGDQTKARKLINSLEISNNVVFTGYVDEKTLKKYYILCDLYVCPSKLEGFGLTLLEAMVAGKPIVATNVGAIPEIVEGYGVLVNSENKDELSEAIVKSLNNRENCDKKDISKISLFSWKKAAMGLSDIYGEIL